MLSYKPPAIYHEPYMTHSQSPVNHTERLQKPIGIKAPWLFYYVSHQHVNRRGNSPDWIMGCLFIYREARLANDNV